MTNQERATMIVEWAIEHWVAVLIGLVVVVAMAFLAAALTEWRKRHISKKTEVKVEGWIVQKTLALSSVLFGGLGTMLPLMHSYLPMLSNVKYIGGFMVTVYAAGNFLYSLKFKKWFTSFQNYLETRQKRLSDAQLEQSQMQPLQPAAVPDSPFEEPA